MTEVRSPLLRTLEHSFTASLDIPMWGNPPSFSWEELNQHLNNNFPCFCESVNAEWREHHDVTKDLGEDPIIIPFSVSPIQSAVFWAMPKSAIEFLTQYFLQGGEGHKSIDDERFQSAFYRYLMLKISSSLQKMTFFNGLLLKTDISTIPHEEAFCIDVRIAIEDKTLHGRLICPRSFQRSFVTHFQKKSFSLRDSQFNPSLTLSIVSGSVTLSIDEYKSLEEGDFLLLDRIFYHPGTKKGLFCLSLEGTPLFHLKVKEEGLKILDFAIYQEENTHMDEFEEENTLPEDNELEFEELNQPSVEEIIQAKNLSLELTVEVGRISVPLQKLLSLSPGNLLEMTSSINMMVSLRHKGQLVGRGELIQIGDHVGVKIHEIFQDK